MSQRVKRQELQSAAVLSRDRMEGEPPPTPRPSFSRDVPLQVPAKSVHKVDGPLECTICEAIVKIVDEYVETNATEVRRRGFAVRNDVTRVRFLSSRLKP